MEMQFDPGYGDVGMDAADFSTSDSEAASEASAEWDATLDTSFPESTRQTITDTNFDKTLDQNLPEKPAPNDQPPDTPKPSEPQPGDLDWQPSDTGVKYPPEKKEGNYGGPERLG